MAEASIYRVLKTLSKDEIKRLDRFLRSPYFTEGRNISPGIIYSYFELLKKFHPDFDIGELTDEKIYSKLYPHGGSSAKIVAKLNSDLLKLTEIFLSYEEYCKNETEVKRNSLIQLSDRRTDKVFLKRFNEMLGYLDKLERDEDYFYETYYIWKNYWKNYFLSKSVYKLDESISHINSFFIYVVLGSLRIYLWGLSYLKMINIGTDFYLFDEIMQHVNKNYKRYKEIPQVLIYFNLIKMSTTGDESYYYSLKDLKGNYFQKLSELDKYNVFIMMTNFCQNKISKWDMKYRNERFELDKEFLDSNLVEWLGGIHFFHFLAITKNAVKLGEYEWVEKKVKELNNRIESRYKDFAVSYINALIYFEQKQFGKALEALSKLKIEYSHQKQYTRNMMIQIYFETGEDDTALSLIDSGRHFINRDRHLGEEAKKKSLNFLGFTERLIRARNKAQPEMLGNSPEKLEKLDGVENKDWLIEKIDEMMKK
jgi:hypothetical protein